MQTFLPYPDFVKSAQSLDYRRLGKQRVEALQVLRTITGQSTSWENHPTIKMWKGYENALAIYGLEVCIEWISRGYVDHLSENFINFINGKIILPPWLGNEDFHRSHRANLVAKNPDFYIPIFGNIPFEPYVWPVK